ncbi:hypothetical protein G6F56_001920 [Rhizopus delemar]|nr:hypothetical protein G6F56_001920 [Rhizopus delemar]
MLPDVGELKHRVEKLKSISKFCTLSANMNGTFKITFETSTAEGEAVYEELENPQLEGHESDRDPLEFAYVCIATEDFDSFLSCHHLEPKSIVCAVTDEMQLAFYAYMNIEQYQTLEAPILPINTPQTVLTCHVPVHLE